MSAEWAWLAGLFEGEGCIVFTGKNSVALAVNLTDLDVLERACEIAGAGRFMSPRDRPGCKTLYAWRIHKVGDVERVLRQIRPWLGERRGQRADAALERLQSVRRPGECKRRHAMGGDNLYVAPGGQRHCRACAQFRDQRRRAKVTI